MPQLCSQRMRRICAGVGIAAMLAVVLTGCMLPFPGEYTNSPLKLSKVDGNLAIAYCGDPGTLVFVDMWVARRSNTARGDVSFEASGSAEIVRGSVIDTAALPAGLTVTADSGYPSDPDNIAVTLEVDGVQSLAQFFFEDDVASIEDWQPNGWMRADGSYSDEPCG